MHGRFVRRRDGLRPRRGPLRRRQPLHARQLRPRFGTLRARPPMPGLRRRQRLHGRRMRSRFGLLPRDRGRSSVDKDACTLEDSCLRGSLRRRGTAGMRGRNPCTPDACDPASGCVFDGGTVPRSEEGGRLSRLPGGRRFVGGRGCRHQDADRARERVRTSLDRPRGLPQRRPHRSAVLRRVRLRYPFRAKQTVFLESSASAAHTDPQHLLGRDALVQLSQGLPHGGPREFVPSRRGRQCALRLRDRYEPHAGDDAHGGRHPDPGDPQRRQPPLRLRRPRIPEAPVGAPRRVLGTGPGGPVGARLVLFTPGFRRGHPPLTDCSVIGREVPGGSQFSSSFQFGCWTSIRLEEIHPEFAYPDLGSERGRIDLRCRVFDETGEAHGGVHGVLVQTDENGAESSACVIPATPAAAPSSSALEIRRERSLRPRLPAESAARQLQCCQAYETLRKSCRLACSRSVVVSEYARLSP